MPSISNVTVYCSSSSALNKVYIEAAAELGRAIATNNWKLVYGGNSVGLMGMLADAVRSAGGKVIGVTPQLFIDKKIHDTLCEELLITATMRERKALMEQRGDAFIALPGGLGTFEEIFEIIVAKQLGYLNKPIVLLNINNYYGPILDQLAHGIEQNFIKPTARELFFVAESVAQTVEHIRNYVPKPPQDKWFSHTLPTAARAAVE